MKKLVTPFRVGLLVLASAGFLFIFLTFAQKGGLSNRESITVWAYFRDASGLSKKSRVQIAGIAVGEISDIVLEGTRAKVFLRIRKEVGIREDAILTKRSESLLGDYLLDLNPGSDASPPLPEGGQIRRVVDSQGIEVVFESLSRITSDINSVTAALRESLGGEKGTASLQTIVDNMVRLSGTVDETVAKSSSQLDAILKNLERVSEDVRGLTSSQDSNIRSILDNLNVITADVRAVTRDIRQAVTATDGGVGDQVASVQGTLGKLDRTLSNIEQVTQEIREGKSAAGKLLSDERLGQKLGESVEDVSDFVTRLTGFQTEVSVRSEYLFAQGEAKNALGLKIIPKPDKYYLLELVDDPRGSVETTIVQNNPPNAGQPATQVQRVTRDTLKVSAEFAKRYYWATLRFGLIESSGGVGADLHFFHDSLTLKFDAFNFNVTEARYPRFRAALRYSPLEHVYASVGIDDAFNTPVRDSVTNRLLTGRDFFVGAGVYFTDDDLKALLTITPVPVR